MKSDKSCSSLNILLDNIEGTNLLLEYYADFSEKIFQGRDFKTIITTFYYELKKIYVNQSIEFVLWQHNKKLVKFNYDTKQSILTPSEEFTPKNSLYNYVLEQQQIVLTNNYFQFCDNLGLDDLNIKASSWLGIPIIVKAKVLGLVVIWDANPERYFRLQDKQFLAAIVNIAGFALENTYLYDYIARHILQGKAGVFPF